MAVTLNASTSSGFIATSDTSGSLELQANGTTKATVGSTGLSIGQYNPSASLLTNDTTKTATGTSVDFTGIPSWVKRITVMIRNVSTNSTSPPQIQLGTSSGVTTSGYIGSNSVVSTGVSTATFTSGFGIGVSTGQWAGVVAVSGAITISLMGSNTWVASGSVGGDNSNVWLTTGSVALSGTLDRIRITTVNGTDTFDNGSINIIYE